MKKSLYIFLLELPLIKTSCLSILDTFVRPVTIQTSVTYLAEKSNKKETKMKKFVGNANNINTQCLVKLELVGHEKQISNLILP